MKWYGSIRTARKPPAYMVERISDLLHASDVSKISPSNARLILDEVISQLNTQMDDEYVEDLRAASDVMLDNPQRARNLIGIVVGTMQADKGRHDLEREKPWLTNYPR